MKTPEDWKKGLEKITGIDFSPYENPMNHLAIKLPVMSIFCILLFLCLFGPIPSAIRMFFLCVFVLYAIATSVLFVLWGHEERWQNW